MAKRYSITVIDEDGAAQAALDVDLYVGDGNATAKTGDFTDNTDGTYYIDVAATGEYTVKIGGVIQTELQSVWISVDDSLTTGDIINTLVSTSTTDALSAAQGKVLQDAKIAIASIVNDLTTGGTAVPLSAEQGKTLQTNKIETTVIGNRTYTYNHQLVNSESITASLDRLDAKVGDFDFSADQLLKSWITIGASYPQYYNLTNAIKILSNQIVANLKAITNGTDIFNRRVVYADFQVAAAATGSSAAAMREYAEAGGATLSKVTALFYKQTGDIYIKVRVQVKVSGGATGLIHLLTSENDLEYTFTNVAYDTFEYTLPCSNYVDNELYEINIGTKISAGAGTATIKDVIVSIEGI